MRGLRRQTVRPGALGRWYAEPLDKTEAAKLLERAGVRERRSLRHGRSCRTCHLLRLVACFWLDQGADTAYRSAQMATARTAHGRALTELVWGQLLASRRRPGAARHLHAGFESASGLLAAADYFNLVRRHALLGRLPPAETPSPPAPLEELLTAASVIVRLERRVRHSHPTGDPADIHG